MLDNLYTELIRRIERSAPNIPLTAFRKIGVKLKFEDFQVTTLEKTGLTLSLEAFSNYWNKFGSVATENPFVSWDYT